MISYNVGEFLTDDPAEITVYNDNVNTGPTGIAFDSQGNVYISELYSGTAVKYGPTGGSPLLVINQGTGGCEGIAVDQNGNIYVSNSTLEQHHGLQPIGHADQHAQLMQEDRNRRIDDRGGGWCGNSALGYPAHRTEIDSRNGEQRVLHSWSTTHSAIVGTGARG